MYIAKNKKEIVSWIILLVVVIIYFVYYYTHILDIINSDMSSELILGKLLANEHGIVSTNWFYSTEIRFIDVNIIYAFVFLFTDSYIAVRMISAPIIVLIYGNSFYYMCKKIGLKKYFAILFSLLIMPFTADYLFIYLVGFFYVFHAAFMFIIIGLLCDISSTNLEKDKKVKIVVLFILSVLAGINGLRLIVIFFLPLLLTTVINFKNNKWFEKYSNVFISFAGSVMGYFINCLLARKYSFMQFGNLNFINPDISRISEVLTSIFACFGYTEGRVISLAFIMNVTCILVIIGLFYTALLIFRKGKSEAFGDDLPLIVPLQLFFLSLLVLCGLFIFTDMEIEIRYFTQVFVLAIPIVGYALKRLETNKIMYKAFAWFIILNWGFHAYMSYENMSISHDSTKYGEIVNYVISNGYEAGYSEFWDGNILTELSNGQIDMYTFNPDKNYIVKDIDDLFEWLQLKGHFTSKPSGKVFILLTKGDTSHVAFADTIKGLNPSFENDEFLLYGFESYEALKSATAQ